MDPKCHVELYFSYALMLFASPSFSTQSVTNLVSILFFRGIHVSCENFFITRVNNRQKSMQPWPDLFYYIIKGIVFFYYKLNIVLSFVCEFRFESDLLNCRSPFLRLFPIITFSRNNDIFPDNDILTDMT